MRKVTFILLAILLWTAKPAEALYIYTFDAGGNTGSPGSTTPISFSFLHETLGPADLGNFNWPEISEDCSVRIICRSDFVAISLPAHCRISTSLDFRFQKSGDFPNEIEMGGFCQDPVTGLFSFFALSPHWHERFDHVGTYISGGNMTLTITEVPDLGSTAMMFALGIGALGLGRRIRKPLHHRT